MNPASLPTKGDKLLFMGAPKTGKSSMAASFPDVVVLNTDGRSNEKYIYPKAVKVLNVNDYDGAIKALDWLQTFKARWRTLVCDTIDQIVVFIDDLICTQHGKLSISEMEYGQGWDTQARLYFSFLSRLFAIGEKNTDTEAIIVISHCGAEDGKKSSMVVRDRLRTYLAGRVESIGHVKKRRIRDSHEFSIDFRGGSGAEAGSRIRLMQSMPPVVIESGHTLYQELLRIMTPDGDTFRRTIASVEERGIPKDVFRAWAKHEFDADERIELYSAACRLLNETSIFLSAEIFASKR